MERHRWSPEDAGLGAVTDAPRAAALIGPPRRPLPSAKHRAPPAAAPPAPVAVAAAKTERAEPIIPSTGCCPPSGTPRTPDGRFDEMAFVRNVVGPDAAPTASATALVARERRREQQRPLRGRASGAARRKRPNRSDASRASARRQRAVEDADRVGTSGQTEQSKTPAQRVRSDELPDRVVL
jgi:hypothetical protein